MHSVPIYAEITCNNAQSKQTLQDSPQDAPSQPIWLSDVILASRVQFLMSVLAPCLPALPKVSHESFDPPHLCCQLLVHCTCNSTPAPAAASLM